MRVRSCSKYLSVFVFIGSVSIPTALAQWASQNYSLQAGWNAIYLELDPATDDVPVEFPTNPPNIIDRFWFWEVRTTGNGLTCTDPVDPECAPDTDTQWRLWQPSNSQNNVNNMRVLSGGRVYLVQASAPGTMTVRGRPSARRQEWQAGLNVVGFHVDPADPPTFAEYLEPSGRHTQQGGVYEIYQMNTAGGLTRIVDPVNTAIQPGRGYWVWANGTFEYDGPLTIDARSLLGVAYERRIVEHVLQFSNLANQPRNAMLRLLPSQPRPAHATELPELGAVTPPPIRYRNYVPEQGYQLTALPLNTAVTFPLSAANSPQPQNARKILQLSVVRQGQPRAEIAFNNRQHMAVLEVTDGNGFRRLLPVTAEVTGSAGLYFGVVTVDHVNWVQADARIAPPVEGSDPERYEQTQTQENPRSDGDTVRVRPTPYPFTFPIIVHYDGGSNYTFLNEVTLLYNPAAQQFVIKTPNCTSCNDLIAGSVLDGQPFAQHVSTAAFSFKNDLPMAGSFSSTLSVSIVVPDNDKLNPFLHRYHPHHDGDRFNEVWGVSRQIEMDFTCTPPNYTERPGDGDLLYIGCYREVLDGTVDGEGRSVPGLHRRPIVVSGSVELRRVSTLATLNQ